MKDELKFQSVGREAIRKAGDYGKCFLTVSTPSGRIRRVYLDKLDLIRVIAQSAQMLDYLEREHREKVKP